jgi:hypothetical protein
MRAVFFGIINSVSIDRCFRQSLSFILLACFYIGVLFLPRQALALHVATTTDNNVVYFLFSAPNQIARFDLATGQDLPVISLSKIPTALVVAKQTAFVAFHRELYKLDLISGDLTYVRGYSQDITSLVILGNYLYTSGGNSTESSILDINGQFISNYGGFYSSNQYIASEKNKAIYFRDSGISPADIHRSVIGENGAVSASQESPYHGDYPSATTVFLNSSQNKVYDNAGIAYFAADLTYAGSLGGAVDALTFVGDNPVVARGLKLQIYSPSDAPKGELTLTAKPNYLASFDQNVFAFITTAAGYNFTQFSLAQFSLPKVGDPVNPSGLAFTPEFIESDGQDRLFMIDKETLSVFVYSNSQKSYVAGWRLLTPPTWATYSFAHKRLYLGFANGQIKYFNTETEAPAEEHLINLPSSVHGLLAVGNYVFAHDPSGAWGTHYLISAQGAIVSSVEWRNLSAQYLYNPSLGRVYHHRDGTSPNDIEWSDFNPQTGVWGASGDSPYHGDTLMVRLPLRVSASGQYLINGGGQILDAASLKILNSLPNNIQDALWIGENLVTVNETGNSLQFWSAAFTPTKSYAFAGAQNIRLFDHEGKLALVMMKNGMPEFKLYDLKNLPDTDGDGIDDLTDNCELTTNADQIDFDQDRIGDACDLDDDNDGLADLEEIKLGLNPQDSTDLQKDDDGDGYSNGVEIRLGSDFLQAQSTPKPITRMQENFDAGVPLGFVLGGSPSAWQWTASGGIDQSGALVLPKFVSGADNFVEFAGVFEPVNLMLKIKAEGSYGYLLQLEVLINGQVVQTRQFDNNWQQIQVEIPKGLNTLKFRVKSDYDFINFSDAIALIDQLLVDKDTDRDGIADAVDNCVGSYNPWQSDFDKDEFGDECDPNPSQFTSKKDTDGDSIIDPYDNCPSVPNTDQSDVDADSSGDACDSFDNRPKDSDQDGLVDQSDNCPFAANANQQDLDRDGKGDACDDDKDGDGALGSVEILHAFMSDTNPLDVLLDSDQDGIDNGFEISHGSDPGQFNQFPSNDLLDYFPMEEGTYTYANEFTFYLIAQTKLATFNEIVAQLPQGLVERYQASSKGIMLTSRSSYFNWQVVNTGTKYVDTIHIPKVLKLGEKIMFDAKQYSLGSVGEPDIIKLSVRLVAMGKQLFNGVEVPTITLERAEYAGDQLLYVWRDTYLKGIGLSVFQNAPLVAYEPKKPQTVTPPESIPEPKPEPKPGIDPAPVTEPKPVEPVPVIEPTPILPVQESKPVAEVKPVSNSTETSEPRRKSGGSLDGLFLISLFGIAAIGRRHRALKKVS